MTELNPRSPETLDDIYRVYMADYFKKPIGIDDCTKYKDLMVDYLVKGYNYDIYRAELIVKYAVLNHSGETYEDAIYEVGNIAELIEKVKR